jgi:nitrate reductase gamma subunit
MGSKNFAKYSIGYSVRMNIYNKIKLRSRKMVNRVKDLSYKFGMGVMGVLATAGMAFAEPESIVSVPAIDTTIMGDAGQAAFTAVAIGMAIIIGLRLFKRA